MFDHHIADVPVREMAALYLRPDARLAPYISGYHVYSAGEVSDQPRHEWFFPGWANVRFRLTEASWKIGFGAATPEEVPTPVVFGASRLGAHSISHGGHLTGFGVTPLGWRRLFGKPAHRFVDRLTPLSALWSGVEALQAAVATASDSADLQRLYDAVILERLGPPGEDDALVARLADLLVSDHDVNLEHTAALLGCTMVKLRRVSGIHFGFAPKVLLRRSRFMKSLVAIYGKPPGQWGQLIDQSYFDQSHFLRDARDFLGMTPSAYLALERPLTLMSMISRREQLGSPVQALHRAAASQRA